MRKLIAESTARRLVGKRPIDYIISGNTPKYMTGEPQDNGTEEFKATVEVFKNGKSMLLNAYYYQTTEHLNSDKPQKGELVWEPAGYTVEG